jgi:CBS-domain-containing membrane protein
MPGSGANLCALITGRAVSEKGYSFGFIPSSRRIVGHLEVMFFATSVLDVYYFLTSG